MSSIPLVQTHGRPKTTAVGLARLGPFGSSCVLFVRDIEQRFGMFHLKLWVLPVHMKRFVYEFFKVSVLRVLERMRYWISIRIARRRTSDLLESCLVFGPI